MDAIEDIVNILGIKHYVLKNDELGCLCLNPDHDDTKLGNFYINITTGLFNCFSCGFRGNVVNLLYRHGASYTKALRLWKILQLDRREEIVLPAKALDKYRIAPFLTQVSEYAVKRVGDENVLAEYGVYADSAGNPVFTTRNYKNEYTSIWVREHGNYLLIEPVNAKKCGVFFGEHLPPTDFTILCEGPFDAMAVRKITGQKALCGFGTQLSEYQLQRLSDMHNVVIFFDGDVAGRRARKQIVNRLYRKGDLYVADGYNCDPDELNEQQLLSVLENIRSAAGFKLYDKQQNVSSRIR